MHAPAHPRKHQLPATRTLLTGGIVLLVLVLLVIQISRRTGDSGTTIALNEPKRVSFVAVGDNLPEGDIGAYADSCAGTVGDDRYDYHAIYEPIKPLIESADLSYVDEETMLGGNELGPKGYPSFNTTDEMADALVDTGFDLIATAGNHSYDWGPQGSLENSVNVWKTKPVVTTGTALSEAEGQGNVIHVVERNGIRFSFLAYTYGLNGYEKGALPWYTVSIMDEDRIRSDVRKAKQQSDVVLVAMHWGTEHTHELDDEQKRFAQLLADLDVDVVMGSHPHIIQSLQWLQGTSGHRTLVAYSLGNFLSNHATAKPDSSLEGMLSCDFVKSDNGIEIQNVAWTPLVNHDDGTRFAVYAVKDYTDELARQNAAFTGDYKVDDPLEWLRSTTREVIGGEFQLNM